MLTKHLYIHVPLCKMLCTFCDFKRELLHNHDVNQVIKYLINSLKKFRLQQFKTIYIGGGTPNVFADKDLDYFLSNIKPFLNVNYEFTIECNPDLITESQVRIFKKNKINRVSLGVQSTNNKILRLLNRTHSIQDCEHAINLLKKYNFKNISLDFMYALPLMKNNDVISAVNFVNKNHVQHVSFYGLDLKPNSILAKQKYVINPDDEADQLQIAINEFKRIGFKRYEVSNWALSKKYQSKHNLAYWLTNDWSAIGYGAHGFENKIHYEYVGSIKQPKKIINKLTKEEYYQQILIMGLRLISGINITIEPYKSAYNYYKDKLRYVVVKNDMLKCVNVNLLNNTLINII